MNNTQDNIDKLTQLVKARLNSSGKVKSLDQNGDTGYVEIGIFSQEQIANFLTISLSNFNQTPKFTNFAFDDSEFINTFTEVLVEGAVLQALGAQALLERGREYAVDASGLFRASSSVSDLLNDQYRMLLSHHENKLQTIKRDFQWVASPLSSGSSILFVENNCLKWRDANGTTTTIGVAHS